MQRGERERLDGQHRSTTAIIRNPNALRQSRLVGPVRRTGPLLPTPNNRESFDSGNEFPNEMLRQTSGLP
jgi:hypothetical protein